MLPCYEPLATDTQLLGMEWVRRAGGWPVMRHLFDCEGDAGLIVDVDSLGGASAYAVGYDLTGGDVREHLLAL